MFARGRRRGDCLKPSLPVETLHPTRNPGQRRNSILAEPDRDNDASLAFAILSIRSGVAAAPSHCGRMESLRSDRTRKETVRE